MYEVANMQNTNTRKTYFLKMCIFVCDFLGIKSIFYILNILFSYKARYDYKSL